MQPPNNQYPNQPHFSNQSPYPNQPPYYQQPPPPKKQNALIRFIKWYGHQLTPQGTRERQMRARQWSQTKRGQTIGCLILVGVLVLCGATLAIANSGNQNSTQVADQATPTQAIVNVGGPTTVPTPTPVPPTATPAPTQPPTPACDGWLISNTCYDTNASGGTLVYNTPYGFCGYVTCVSTFNSNANGYIVECVDSHWSHSGGVQGACSKNGGIAATLYSH